MHPPLADPLAAMKDRHRVPVPRPRERDALQRPRRRRQRPVPRLPKRRRGRPQTIGRRRRNPRRLRRLRHARALGQKRQKHRLPLGSPPIMPPPLRHHGRRHVRQLGRRALQAPLFFRGCDATSITPGLAQRAGGPQGWRCPKAKMERAAKPQASPLLPSLLGRGRGRVPR